MRIISGEYGGRPLKTVADMGLRPAMGKTREALFSLLEAAGLRWSGLKVLDLFAGCGSLGFECLSRGAERVDFVENAQKQCRCILENAENLDAQDRCGLHRMDVLRFLRKPGRNDYGLIFLDPPYGKKLVEKCLGQAALNNFQENPPIIVAEMEKCDQPRFPEGFNSPICRVFGQTAVHIWNLP